MKKWISMLVCALMLVGGCAQAEEVKSADTGFSILKDKYEANGNGIVSPMSLYAAILMAADGANGETLQQLQDATGISREDMIARLDELKEAGVTVANGAFVGDIGLTDEYKQSLADWQAETFDITLEDAYRKVNEFVSEKTNGQIEELLSGEPDDQLKLVLLNAIALDAKWANKFEADATSDGVFMAPDGNVNATYMHMTEFLTYAQSDIMQTVVLPYAQGGLSMTVVLPMDGMMDDVLTLLAQQGMAALPAGSEHAVSLSLPKVKLEEKASDLIENLKALGVTLPFGEDADFSGMSAQELFIGGVKQGCTLEVNEDGTVAVAATSVEMIAKSALMQDIAEMNVNRPYIMVISDESGDVVFAATVNNPAKE